MITINLVDFGLCRGSQPLTADHYAALKSLGVKWILDLETGAHWLADGDPLKEALSSESYGIRSYCHPLGAVLPPTRQELLDALQFIADHPMTYVHCREGVDRTGMVCAAYRIKNNKWSVRAAVNEMRALGFHWWYFYWTHVLETL